MPPGHHGSGPGGRFETPVRGVYPAENGGVDDQRRVWVRQLLEFPAGHPYAKFTGAHWRLVELADLGPDLAADLVEPRVEAVLGWLAEAPHARVIAAVRSGSRPRLHASIPGNGVYACTRLGFGLDPRVESLVEVLLAAQWPDGGWNCDRHPEVSHASFHETVTPAIGLAVFGQAVGSADALAAARRAAELLLEHGLFRRRSTGAVVHPSWIQLHYPPYWHYDVLQGLRLLLLLGLLGDERASEGLDVLESRRTTDGGFAGRTWASNSQPAAVDYGRGMSNAMLRERAQRILDAAGRSAAR